VLQDNFKLDNGRVRNDYESPTFFFYYFIIEINFLYRSKSLFDISFAFFNDFLEDKKTTFNLFTINKTVSKNLQIKWHLR